MADLTLDLEVFDVDGRLIVDPAVVIRLASPNGSSAAAWRVAFQGERETLTLEGAPPGDALVLRVTPSRYRDIQIICRVQSGQVLPASDEALTIPRRPSEWLPLFARWGALPAPFDSLKRVLQNSPVFRLGRASNPELVVGDTYDAVEPGDESSALAKLALLNLYSRVGREIAPTTGVPWFNHVQELLLATRERFVAEIDETCLTAVHLLAAHPQSGYVKAKHRLHIPNFQAIPGVTGLTELASVKSNEAKGNLQFTVTRAERDGRPVCLLDADIDENGNLLLHTFDLVRHVFTGGTHPLDVHEALRARFPDVPIGCEFEPRALIPHVTTRIIAGAAAAPSPMGAAAVAEHERQRAAATGDPAPARFHVSQDETGYFQLTYEDEHGALTLVSHQFDTPKQLIEDAVEMAESGEFGDAVVVVDGRRRGVAETASAAARDERPAPRRADA